MSVEETGSGERGRECESETKIIFTYILNVASWAHVSKIIIFYTFYNDGQ